MNKRLAAALALLAGHAGAADSLHHHAVVARGGTDSAGGTRLDYSIGQPLSGTVSRADLVLHSGVLALFPAPAGDVDRIFRDGFETAPPRDPSNHRPTAP